MPDPVLRLLPDDALDDRGGPTACRVPGCASLARGRLGFCRSCDRRYHYAVVRRGRLVDALCARLRTVGDPVFAAFGGQRHDLGAHVLAHLEELDALNVHVPDGAIEDYVAELDSRLREAQ